MHRSVRDYSEKSLALLRSTLEISHTRCEAFLKVLRRSDINNLLKDKTVFQTIVNYCINGGYGVSATQLADKTGYTCSQIGRWKNYHATPALRTRIAIKDDIIELVEIYRDTWTLKPQAV